jgi:hypothetical protein
MDSSVAIKGVLDKLPVAELDESLSDFVAPFTAVLPDARLRQVVPLAVRGIVTGQSPLVTTMAQSVARTISTEEEKKNQVWAAAKRIYRFLGNPRLGANLLQEGLYECARAIVEEEKPKKKRVVVALDPVNFEKPYTHKLEGVCTVHKSTPPDRHGKARLARGYPAITAKVVNTRVPATTYANWSSYTTEDFISENREIYRAIRSTRRVFPEQRLRFIGDSGLDDKKIFEWIASVEAEKAKAEFVIRASHLNRRVEVYNRRLDRWEAESLQDLVQTVPFSATWQVTFKHAGETRLATVKVGWLHLRLPDSEQELWAVVAEEYDVADKAVRTLVLLASVPVFEVAQAQELYEDWRLRGRIEHGYRFCQEAGLDVEDMRVRSVERMRRVFVLVLLAAQFVMYLTKKWPAVGVGWLRLLGGKLGLQIDRDGPYQVLQGLSAVWQTVATLTLLRVCPFPQDAFT